MVNLHLVLRRIHCVQAVLYPSSSHLVFFLLHISHIYSKKKSLTNISYNMAKVPREKAYRSVITSSIVGLCAFRHETGIQPQFPGWRISRWHSLGSRAWGWVLHGALATKQSLFCVHRQSTHTGMINRTKKEKKLLVWFWRMMAMYRQERLLNPEKMIDRCSWIRVRRQRNVNRIAGYQAVEHEVTCLRPGHWYVGSVLV